jgi:hypothetical protein
VVISATALFVALGGIGYAQSQLPAGSVGTAQLQNHAVTGSKLDLLSVGFRKIQFGAVGVKRINPNTVQARVGGTCSSSSAINAVDVHGNVQCTPAGPKEFGASSAATPVTTSTPIQSLGLAAGSTYLVTANPQITVTTAGAPVEVDCTLATGPASSTTPSQTRSVTFLEAPTGQTTNVTKQMASVPLTIAVPSSTSAATAAVTCSRTTTNGTPTVTVATAINALTTASNS